MTDTYGDNNKVSEYTTITMSGTPQATVVHNNNGNLTKDHRGYSYLYDYENRLIRIYIDDNPGGGYNTGDIDIAEFEYAALGRRIEKVDAVANTTTRYYYDDQRVMLETAVSGTETDIRYFVWGNYIDELLVMHNIAGGSIDYVFSHDHLYSPVIAYVGDFSFYREAEGTSFERYEYDVYGAVTVYTNMSDWDTASPTTQGYSNCGNPYTFTGRRLDKFDGGDLNLMYYRARTYDPQTGRFMQRDPLGIDPAGKENNPFYIIDQYYDGMNLYEYVRGMVAVSSDPDGLRKRKIDTKAFINAFLSELTGVVGAKQDVRICTRVMGVGCACLTVRGEMTLTNCCKGGQRTICNINRLEVNIGLYACESLGGTGSFTPPFPGFKVTWSPARKRPLPAPIVGVGNMNCPKEGIDGNFCITASAGFSAFTYGARGCYSFGNKTWNIETGLGIGTGTGIAGGGGVTVTKCGLLGT